MFLGGIWRNYVATILFGSYLTVKCLEPNEKQTLDMIPSKSKLQTKLAYNSTKLKSLRANVSHFLK